MRITQMLMVRTFLRLTMWLTHISSDFYYLKKQSPFEPTSPVTVTLVLLLPCAVKLGIVAYTFVFNCVPVFQPQTHRCQAFHPPSPAEPFLTRFSMTSLNMSSQSSSNWIYQRHLKQLTTLFLDELFSCSYQDMKFSGFPALLPTSFSLLCLNTEAPYGPGLVLFSTVLFSGDFSRALRIISMLATPKCIPSKPRLACPSIYNVHLIDLSMSKPELSFALKPFASLIAHPWKQLNTTLSAEYLHLSTYVGINP